jgi:shikimate kinase
VNIYLIGFMGSGKSTAGKRVAALLRWRFEDIDRMVELKEGMKVPEIFSARGEAYFRSAESAALREVSARTRTVVACGGGTPCSPENLQVMKSTGVTVYLKLSVENLVSRLSRHGNDRPLLRNTDSDTLVVRVSSLLGERSQWYEQADLIIDAALSEEEEMTSLIAETLRSKGAYL